MRKRGISEIIAAVLIVLISIVGAILLYTPIKNLLSDDQIRLPLAINPEFSIVDVNFSYDCGDLKIRRNFVGDRTVGIRFAFKNSTNSFIYDQSELDGELEVRRYRICLQKNVTRVTDIEVAGIMNKEGKEVLGGKDIWKFSPGYNLEGVSDPKSGFIFTFFRYFLDSDYNPILVDEVMKTGYTHVGISKYSRDSDVSQELNHIRQRGYKIALHMSSGHKSDGPYPELANALADKGNQLFKTACIDKDLCENWNNTNHAVSPSYTGILWQNTLDNIRNDTSLIKPDIALIDTELWSNVRDAEYYFLSGDPNRDCNCYAIRDGIGYDNYNKNWSARGKEMYGAVKELNSTIKVLFYDELKPGINKTLAYYNSSDIMYAYGYMPPGTGDIPNPSIYIGPNLDLYEKNSNLGVFNETIPYVSFSYMNGFSNFNGGNVFYDSSVSREAGRIMARAGARGFILFPIQGPTHYIVEHSRAMIEGFYEGNTYVEKNKIRNPDFESFKTQADGYDYNGPDGAIRLVGDIRFIPVFWSWEDTNFTYNDSTIFANLTSDRHSGMYAWRHSRLGDTGNRIILSRNFTISAGEEGYYDLNIWTRSSVNSDLGKITYFVQGNVKQIIGENNFADNWNKFYGKSFLEAGDYRLGIEISDRTGQNIDLVIDDVSLQRSIS